MDSLGTAALILAAVSQAAFWAGMAITTVRAYMFAREPKPTISRSDLMGTGEVTLHANELTASDRLIIRSARVSQVLAVLFTIFAGIFYSPWLAFLIVLMMLPMIALHHWAVTRLGRTVALGPDGFVIEGRAILWTQLADLALGRAAGAFFTPPRSVEGGRVQAGRADAVLYRVNRALVQMPRSNAYWDGAIVNAYGIETADLLDAMRFRRARAEAASQP